MNTRNKYLKYARSFQLAKNGITRHLLFKVEENFYYCLTKRTQLEMAKLNVKSVKEMYELINTTENTMIEQMKSYSTKKRKNR